MPCTDYALAVAEANYWEGRALDANVEGRPADAELHRRAANVARTIAARMAEAVTA